MRAAERERGSLGCTPPQLLTMTPDHRIRPCLRNEFTITHSQGFGPFRYQWRRLVPGTTTRVDLVDGDNVSGATTDRLVIDPFRPANEGSYDVVVSNLCGSTTSGLTTVPLVDGGLDFAPSLPEGACVIRWRTIAAAGASCSTAGAASSCSVRGNVDVDDPRLLPAAPSQRRSTCAPGRGASGAAVMGAARLPNAACGCRAVDRRAAVSASSWLARPRHSSLLKPGSSCMVGAPAC